MHKFLSKYALAAHLALLAVAPLFLFPFFGAYETAVTVLWLSLLTGLWFFLEPSRRIEEYLYNARMRVFRSTLADPLFWAFCMFLVLAFIRWMNDGVQLVYDLSGKQWQWLVSAPALQWLPGSDSESGFVSFAVLVAVMTAVSVCRHALGKSARVMFVFLSSLFAGIAAVAAVFTATDPGSAASAMAWCDYSSPSFAGSAFGMFFLASIVALAGMFECGWNKALLLFSFALGATFAGLWYFAPPAVIALYTAAGAVFTLLCTVYVAVSKGSVAFFKLLVAYAFATLVPVAVLLFAAPAELVEAKSAVLDMQFFPEGYSATRDMYSAMASDIWQRGNIWHGGGLGSLPLYIRLDLSEVYWVRWIPNGWWQLLAERGLIGLAMLVVPFCLMTFTFIARAVRSRGRRVFWPLAVFGAVSVALAAVEGFFNASFMRPEVLVSTGAFFALGASSFPPGTAGKDAKNDKAGK